MPANQFAFSNGGMQFIDLDVMAIGDVVHEVTQDFNRYWSYASARPIERLLRTGGGTTRQVRPDAAHTKQTGGAIPRCGLR